MEEAVAPAPEPKSERLMSLDALRGFDMFWIVGGNDFVGGVLTIIFGTLPQSVQHQFDHTEWIGFTAWDLIMPLFLFMAGTAMPYSIGKRLERHDNKLRIYGKILRRFVILFVLGMAAQGHLLEWDLSKLHIYCNTLQAIACGYVIAAVMMLNFSLRGQVAATVLLLLGFWALMTFVPVPGFGAGSLTPQDNLAMYIDHAILGHFRDGTPYTWILSSMTFGASVLLGAMGGHILKSDLPQLKKAGVIAGLGVSCLLVGWVWGFEFPIIKHIWTSSMTLWTAGWSYLLLALFYLVIDVLGFRRWAFFFVVIDMNSIFAYMASEIYDFKSVSNVFIGSLIWRMGQYGPFVNELGGLVVLWLVLLYMYRKKTFIRV